jgi:hypothetical protein
MGLSEEVEAEYKEAYACFAQDKQGEDKGKLSERRRQEIRWRVFPSFHSILHTKPCCGHSPRAAQHSQHCASPFSIALTDIVRLPDTR